MSSERDLRTRLSEQSDAQLLELLRRHDAEQWRPEVFPLAEEILRSRGLTVPVVEAAESNDEAEPELVPVARFATVVESDACRSALGAAGFDVVALDECLLRLDPGLAPGLGGLRLAVPAEQAEEARTFLAAADNGELSDGAIECPACASRVVSSERQLNRGGTVINYLFGVPTTDASVSFRCGSCGNKWD